MSTAALQYLDFDYSEDEHGLGTFDAMASVLPAQVPALHAELTRVLAWACKAFARGALDEGFDWDYDLQLLEAASGQGAIHFDEAARSLRVQAPTSTLPGARHTISLTLSGSAAFCAALRQVFGLDD